MSTIEKPAVARLGTKIKAYFFLTKPRVIELLLIATVPAMILAERGLPSLWLIFATVFGGALSAGSANAFNCYIDSDIDKVMGRTKNRPLVTGELTNREAFIFAWAIGIASVVWFAVVINLLSALLSLIAILFYVFVYTLGLKRRTYWPLSMRYLDEYKEAGVPMLPVVAKNEKVGRQIILYAYAYFASTLLLIPVANMGMVYTVSAVLTGIWFTWESHRLYAEARVSVPKNPMRLFHASITHLTILFLAIAIDPLIYF